MQDQKLISVIAIFYNSESYCRKCLNSILGQKNVNIELIAVDDCSVDMTRAILSEYASSDFRVRLIFHDKNQGISCARNSGLDASTGDCFFFIDGDDWLPNENSLETLMRFWSPDVDWVAGSYDSYSEKGKLLRKMILPSVRCLSKADILTKWEKLDWVYIHNRLYHKKFKKYKFVPGVIHEDRFYNLDLYGDVQHIVQIPDITYSYLSRTTSFSSESRFGEKYLRDGMSLLTKMLQNGKCWRCCAKPLAGSFLKCLYLGDCSKRTRLDFLFFCRENNLLPTLADVQKAPRIYRLILWMTKIHLPDVFIKTVSVCYKKIKRTLNQPI